jgi:single-stranded-DNA-specific exonuclease
MFAQILPLLEGLGDDDDAFVMRDDSWNSGLLGLVASRIAQYTGRPAALVSGLNGDPAKGSVRSVPGFSAHAALVSCSEHLATHGGHAAAAGFSVANENFDAFRETFVARWRDHRAAGWEPEPLEYDGELPLPALTRRVVEQLKRLEPFGQGNPLPVLGAKGVTVQSIRRMGDDGSHLALDLAQGPVALRAVSFSNGDLADHLHLGQVVDILFVPRLNTWRGRTTVQLELVDLKFPQSEGDPASPPAPAQTAPETREGAA